jgi:hypothetical protein
MQRPTGVTVLAIVLLVSAAFRFIVSFLDFGIGSWLTTMSASPGSGAPAAPAGATQGNLGFWIGLGGMLVALVMLIAARGLWMLETWGWWLTVACLLVGLTLNMGAAMQGAYTTRTVGLAIFDAVFLAYLFTPQVRTFFTSAPPDTSAPA